MSHRSISTIGSRIRVQRRKLGMSLDALAERTNLSKSFLSQVERGLTNPSIDSLSVIADAIRVPMFLFFVEEDGEAVIQRRRDMTQLQVPDSRFIYESMWFGENRKMEILIGRLQPGQCSSDELRSHSAGGLTTVDECFVVLEGTVEFYLDEDVYILEQGDSAYFQGNVPHRFCALGNQELVLLFAVAPPAMSR